MRAPVAVATQADERTPRSWQVFAALREAAPAEIPESAAPTTHPLPPAQQKVYATKAAPPATVEIVPE
jgi:hypothetical protein